MNCPECGGDTRVVDSRPHKEGVWRRRKCAAGHLSYTLECQAPAPAKRLPKPPAKPKEPKPLPAPKRKAQVAPPAEDWNLKVTDATPLWVRSMAMKLG
jgi:hypothetical protein